MLLLAALSSKKNSYLDILNESDADYVQCFLNFLEKYLHIEAKEDTTNRSSTRKTFYKTKTIVKNDCYENEKKLFLRKLEVLEFENSELSKKNEETNNQLIDMELKYKDSLREIEILKMNFKNNLQAEKDSFDDALIITNLKEDVLKREFEIEDIKLSNELSLKNANDEIIRLKNKLETLDDKIDVLKSTQYENEKLKLKIKELHIVKDKLADYEVLEANLEAKNRQIEKLIKEKQGFIMQTDKLMKENMTEREKHRQVDYEKKKLESEFKDFTNNPEVKSFIRKSTIMFNRNPSTLCENTPQVLSNILEAQEVEKKDSNTSVRSKLSLEELHETVQHLTQDLDDANKLYSQQLEVNQVLVKEKEALMSQNHTLQIEIENLNIQKDRVQIEKERVELDRTKDDLEKNKYKLSIAQLETEKKKLFEEKAELIEKLHSIDKGRVKYDKEVNNLKLQLKEANGKIDALLNEKKALTTEFKELQVINEKLKKNVDNGSSFNPHNLSSPGVVTKTTNRKPSTKPQKLSPRSMHQDPSESFELQKLKVEII
jgi:hypothetical protein